VFLDSEVRLNAYPKIATSGLAAQSKVVTVGRVKNAQPSRSDLYVSAKVAVTSGSSMGFEYDYSAPLVIERGDSGGASYIPSSHTIVSVNSTGGDNVQLMARVDLVSDWIQKELANPGGTDNGNGPGAPPGGTSPDPGSPGGYPGWPYPGPWSLGGDTATPPGSAPSCAGNSLNGAACP
jgi:hypothetical protein